MQKPMHRIVMIAGFHATVLAAGWSLAADQILLPDDSCTRYWGGNSAIEFAGYGQAINVATDGTDHGIDCAVGQDQALDTNDDILVYFDDNNSTSGKNIVCQVLEVDEDWSSVVYVDTKYGCGTTGGCTTDPGVFAAEGYLSFADVSHGGAYQAEIFCLIPSNLSEIRTIAIDEQ
ncbi:MAG: hypothetical protein R3B13_37420 [Polyangiaceae bacterium]